MIGRTDYSLVVSSSSQNVNVDFKSSTPFCLWLGCTAEQCLRWKRERAGGFWKYCRASVGFHLFRDLGVHLALFNVKTISLHRMWRVLALLMQSHYTIITLPVYLPLWREQCDEINPWSRWADDPGGAQRRWVLAHDSTCRCSWG